MPKDEDITALIEAMKDHMIKNDLKTDDFFM